MWVGVHSRTPLVPLASKPHIAIEVQPAALRRLACVGHRADRPEGRKGVQAVSKSFVGLFLAFSTSCVTRGRSKASSSLRYKLSGESSEEASRATPPTVVVTRQIAVEPKPTPLWRKIVKRTFWFLGGKGRAWRRELSAAKTEADAATFKARSLQNDFEAEQRRRRGAEEELEAIRPTLHAAERDARQVPQMAAKIEAFPGQEEELRSAIELAEVRAAEWEEQLEELQACQELLEEYSKTKVDKLETRLMAAEIRLEQERILRAQRAQTA